MLWSRAVSISTLCSNKRCPLNRTRKTRMLLIKNGLRLTPNSFFNPTVSTTSKSRTVRSTKSARTVLRVTVCHRTTQAKTPRDTNISNSTRPYASNLPSKTASQPKRSRSKPQKSAFDLNVPLRNCNKINILYTTSASVLTYSCPEPEPIHGLAWGSCRWFRVGSEPGRKHLRSPLWCIQVIRFLNTTFGSLSLLVLFLLLNLPECFRA